MMMHRKSAGSCMTYLMIIGGLVLLFVGGEGLVSGISDSKGRDRRRREKAHRRRRYQLYVFQRACNYEFAHAG